MASATGPTGTTPPPPSTTPTTTAIYVPVEPIAPIPDNYMVDINNPTNDEIKKYQEDMQHYNLQKNAYDEYINKKQLEEKEKLKIDDPNEYKKRYIDPYEIKSIEVKLDENTENDLKLAADNLDSEAIIQRAISLINNGVVDLDVFKEMFINDDQTIKDFHFDNFNENERNNMINRIADAVSGNIDIGDDEIEPMLSYAEEQLLTRGQELTYDQMVQYAQDFFRNIQDEDLEDDYFLADIKSNIESVASINPTLKNVLLSELDRLMFIRPEQRETFLTTLEPFFVNISAMGRNPGITNKQIKEISDNFLDTMLKYIKLDNDKNLKSLYKQIDKLDVLPKVKDRIKDDLQKILSRDVLYRKQYLQKGSVIDFLNELSLDAQDEKMDIVDIKNKADKFLDVIANNVNLDDDKELYNILQDIAGLDINKDVKQTILLNINKLKSMDKSKRKDALQPGGLSPFLNQLSIAGRDPNISMKDIENIATYFVTNASNFVNLEENKEVDELFKDIESATNNDTLKRVIYEQFNMLARVDPSERANVLKNIKIKSVGDQLSFRTTDVDYNKLESNADKFNNDITNKLREFQFRKSLPSTDSRSLTEKGVKSNITKEIRPEIGRLLNLVKDLPLDFGTKQSLEDTATILTNTSIEFDLGTFKNFVARIKNEIRRDKNTSTKLITPRVVSRRLKEPENLPSTEKSMNDLIEDIKKNLERFKKEPIIPIHSTGVYVHLPHQEHSVGNINIYSDTVENVREIVIPAHSTYNDVFKIAFMLSKDRGILLDIQGNVIQQITTENQYQTLAKKIMMLLKRIKKNENLHLIFKPQSKFHGNIVGGSFTKLFNKNSKRDIFIGRFDKNYLRDSHDKVNIEKLHSPVISY